MAGRTRCSVDGCPEWAHANGLCGKHLMRLRRTGSTELATFEDRFWARVSPLGPLCQARPDLGRCWRWLERHSSGGYAVVWRAGTWTHAHRVAWELAGGEQAPAGLRFEHFACEHRWCVNPAHVRPLVAVDTVAGARFLAEWNARHASCLSGHLFTSANSLQVPGGRACRTCRHDVALARRQRR